MSLEPSLPSISSKPLKLLTDISNKTSGINRRILDQIDELFLYIKHDLSKSHFIVNLRYDPKDREEYNEFTVSEKELPK